ncbi:MAG: helix-turn-helix domain-containing protein [Pseudonocardiaceae bacterium]
MAEVSPDRARLGERLRELRAGTFRSGAALARHLGWQQTRVNKLERGLLLPDSGALDLWVEATGAGAEVRAELGELLAHARIQYSRFAEVYRGGDAPTITTVSAEDRPRLLRGYQPAMIPGLLQTAAYAREMLTICGRTVLADFTPEGVEALVARRVRRQELLYEPGRRVQYVIGQAALSLHFGTTATLLGQLDRLVGLMDLPSLDLRVLPSAAPCPVMPLTGFWLDPGGVRIETYVGEQTLTASEDVGAYGRAFEALLTAAHGGSDAVALIQQVAAELRGSQAKGSTE